MSIFVKGGRAAKALTKAKRKSAPIARKAAFIVGAGAVGSIAYSDSAVPGLKKQAAKEGFVMGAAAGAGMLAVPKIAKYGAKKTVQKGKVLFRRIKGKIVPVRSK